VAAGARRRRPRKGMGGGGGSARTRDAGEELDQRSHRLRQRHPVLGADGNDARIDLVWRACCRRGGALTRAGARLKPCIVAARARRQSRRGSLSPTRARRGFGTPPRAAKNKKAGLEPGFLVL